MPRKGERCSAALKRKISESRRGQTLSDETKRKLSEALRGRPKSDEAKAKIGAANIGRKRGPLSDEHRQRLSEARARQGDEGRWAPPPALAGKDNGMFKHGLSRTGAAKSFNCMHNRCEHHADYAGVNVCARWSRDAAGLAAFVADMGERPEGHELHRIDNDGDYTPDNCEWVPQSAHRSYHAKEVTHA